MKKQIIKAVLALSFLTTVLSFAEPVLAATGYWTSVISWDANGLSAVGTTNRSSYAGFHLYVKRANGDNIGYKYVELGLNESGSHQAWGQPALDRYGAVSPTRNNVVHDPWFNS